MKEQDEKLLSDLAARARELLSGGPFSPEKLLSDLSEFARGLQTGGPFPPHAQERLNAMMAERAKHQGTFERCEVRTPGMVEFIFKRSDGAPVRISVPDAEVDAFAVELMFIRTLEGIAMMEATPRGVA